MTVSVCVKGSLQMGHFASSCFWILEAQSPQRHMCRQGMQIESRSAAMHTVHSYFLR